MSDVSYVVRDGNGALKSLKAWLLGGIYYPGHAMLALFSNNPSPLQASADGYLLTQGALSASGVTPVASTFTGTGVSLPFTPISGRPFNITISGTFAATVQLQRSFNGTDFFPLTGGGFPISTWTAPASEYAVEYEVGVIYQLDCTAFVSGTVNYRISQ